MKKRTLGANGPEVSTIGLGCMAMSEFYGKSDDTVSKKVILRALELGITMLDTADTYGLGHNETLIGKVIKVKMSFPFPRTRYLTYLEENIAAVSTGLSQEEIEQLETIFYPGAVVGERYTAEGMVGVNV